MRQRLLLLFAVMAFLTGCNSKNDPCASIDAPLSLTSFMLVDSASDEPLIGSGKMYDPDSVDFLNNNPPFSISQSHDSIVTVLINILDSGEEIEFFLSENEKDTIKIEYIIRETECFDIKELKRFFYNGGLIQPNGDGLHVIKK
jgi:hypothetical protein